MPHVASDTAEGIYAPERDQTMRRLFMPWRKPEVLDEAGRWSVRVALLAIDEDVQSIVDDVARVATPSNRDSLLARNAPEDAPPR